MNRYLRRKQQKLAKQRKELGLVKVPIKSIKAAPLQRTELPAAFVTRIQYVHSVFGEYFKDGMEGWVEGFMRDAHPEDEMLIWEGMALAYTRFISKGDFTSTVRKEVYKTLLTNTMAGDMEHKHLTPEQVENLDAEHNKAWEELKASKLSSILRGGNPVL